MLVSFNTASGKYCCNEISSLNVKKNLKVSIPQAVSTVATEWASDNIFIFFEVSIPQAVSTVATSGNARMEPLYEGKFQYRKR